MHDDTPWPVNAPIEQTNHHQITPRPTEEPRGSNSPPSNAIVSRRSPASSATTCRATNEAIVQTLERAYPSVERLRLDPNLRTLVGRDLLENRRLEARAEYHLTDDGRALLLQRAERFADTCGIGAAESERTR